MADRTVEDEETLRALSDRMTAAEVKGDLEFLAGILANDVVIIPPGIPAIEGPELCLQFMSAVIEETNRLFTREIIYTLDDVTARGDIAWDRGTFTQTLVPKEGGDQIIERGQFLRSYARLDDGEWKLTRAIWNRADEGEEPEESAGAAIQTGAGTESSTKHFAGPADLPPVKNRSAARHYSWGGVCEGWRLLDGSDLSVIEERIPPLAGEVTHLHARARQLFYVLEGQLLMELGDSTVVLRPGDSQEVPPGQPHGVRNLSDVDAVFIVVSAPSTRGDRLELQ